jgi:hypothetical protein
MKPFLVLAFFLLLAMPMHAQRGGGAGSGGHSGPGGSVGPGAAGGPIRAGGGATPYYAGGGGGDWFGSEIGPSDFSASTPYDPPTEFGIVSDANDGPFVPSTFMNYDDALALGRQQMAAAQQERKGEAAISLGEFARSYRAKKTPTFGLRSRIVQDDAGKLQKCNLNGNECRRV